jgi:hypothetical protein
VLSVNIGVGIRTLSDLLFLRIFKKFADVVASDDTSLYRSDKQKLHEIGSNASYRDDIKNAHV